MRPRRWRGVLLLVLSIGCEVCGTLLLPASQGFTHPWPSVGVLGGYATSILLFCRALEHGLALGVAYGTLTGIGLAAATVSSALVFGAALEQAQIVGLALILTGALLLQAPMRARGEVAGDGTAGSPS